MKEHLCSALPYTPGKGFGQDAKPHGANVDTLEGVLMHEQSSGQTATHFYQDELKIYNSDAFFLLPITVFSMPLQTVRTKKS